MSLGNLLTSKELCVLLRIKPATLHMRIYRGGPVPPGFKVGNSYRWPEKLVTAWLADHPACRA